METQVPKSLGEVCPLLAGMEIPFATEIAEDGNELNLNEAVRQPAVLVFCSSKQAIPGLKVVTCRKASVVTFSA